jgi:hypothetical protein
VQRPRARECIVSQRLRVAAPLAISRIVVTILLDVHQ